MKPILTTLCAALAGCLLTLASWERPETAATPAQPAIPEATPVIVTSVTAPDETVTPPPAVDVDAYTVVAPQPVLTSYGDCANGVCAPRAATVQRYQPQTRRGLFGGRFFGRR